MGVDGASTATRQNKIESLLIKISKIKTCASVFVAHLHLFLRWSHNVIGGPKTRDRRLSDDHIWSPPRLCFSRSTTNYEDLRRNVCGCKVANSGEPGSKFRLFGERKGLIAMASKRLAGKVGIVTGASKGIGAGIAKYLAAEGASVVVNYASSKEGAEQVVNEITKEGGKAIAVQGDVAKTKDVEHLFAETKKAFGRLDILVNNAGVYQFARARRDHRRSVSTTVRYQCLWFDSGNA